LHAGTAAGEAALLAFYAAGALGTPLGGRLAARWGRIPVLHVAYALGMPALAGVWLVPGPAVFVAIVFTARPHLATMRPRAYRLSMLLFVDTIEKRYEEAAVRSGPLRPLARVITWLFGLSALLIVIANVAALGWLPGTGVAPACADVTGPTGPLPAGSTLTSDGIQVCTDTPSTLQRLAGMGHQVPQALFALGALLLLLRFLRTAAHQCPYADPIPGALVWLGWFVLIGAPLSNLLFTLSQHYLRTTLVTGAPAGDWLSQWGNGYPWWSLAVGVAVLVFAHILRIGVTMRADLEGTV
jgi:hypothetical protein